MPESYPYVHRFFGYARIFWTVKHFWLLSCIKNWEINSPTFDVQTTRWRLLLRPMSQDVSRRHMCAYLQRLPSDDGPEFVRVHWKVRARRYCCCCHLLKEKEQIFRRGDHRHGEVIENMEYMPGYFKPFGGDDLLIECELVVDNPEMSSKKWWLEVDDEGLRSLSDDLHDLFRKGHFSDMVINVGGVDVPAVKAIMCVRNETMANIIKRDNSATVIQFPDDDMCLADANCCTSCAVNTDAVWHLIGYLHYGRMDEIVFGQPSVSAAECARILDVEEVSAHYRPDELILKTKLDVEEHVVTWSVTNFEEENSRPIVSPTLIHNSSEEDGLAWRLVLYPRGKGGTSNHVAIYAEASGGRDRARSKLACLEFALTDGEQSYRCYRRLQKTLGETFESLGVEDFLEHPLLWEDGQLLVKFRLRISDGAVRLSKVHDHGTSVAAFPGGRLEYLKCLSSDMERLLWENPVYCDFTIRCSGDYSFRVHRSIMAARARSFSALAGKSNELDLGHLNVSATVVTALLSYIYCGQLQGAKGNMAAKLLMLAEYLGVEALARTCSRIVDEDRVRFVSRGQPSPQVE